MYQSKPNCDLSSYRNLDAEDPPDPQLMRLDNMLIAEGVTGPDKSQSPSNIQVRILLSNLVSCLKPTSQQDADTTIMHSEYKAKLNQIRNIYNEELEK